MASSSFNGRDYTRVQCEMDRVDATGESIRVSFDELLFQYDALLGANGNTFRIDRLIGDIHRKICKFVAEHPDVRAAVPDAPPDVTGP